MSYSNRPDFSAFPAPNSNNREAECTKTLWRKYQHKGALLMYQETVTAREGERYANNAMRMHTCLHRKAVKAQTTSLFTEMYGTPKKQCGTSRATLQSMPNTCTSLINMVRGTKKVKVASHSPRKAPCGASKKRTPTVYVSLLQKAARGYFVPQLEKRDRGTPFQTKSGESLGQRRSLVFDDKQTKLRGVAHRARSLRRPYRCKARHYPRVVMLPPTRRRVPTTTHKGTLACRDPAVLF